MTGPLAENLLKKSKRRLENLSFLCKRWLECSASFWSLIAIKKEKPKVSLHRADGCVRALPDLSIKMLRNSKTVMFTSTRKAKTSSMLHFGSVLSIGCRSIAVPPNLLAPTSRPSLQCWPCLFWCREMTISHIYPCWAHLIPTAFTHVKSIIPNKASYVLLEMHAALACLLWEDGFYGDVKYILSPN